ncbi:MAG: pyridoxine 5'-phosphate synthase [Desulfuromonadales bacterium]|nr:pyridoxine 5'-phosphate synthase [Desulfuromonadales bacterium]
MAKLGVNVDHIATLRQARGGKEPDPVAAAAIAELAGADGITVHLREDRRHIQDRDVMLLRRTVQSHLNLEMAATDEMVSIALKVKPDYVTLVPEKRQELTTEGGLDVVKHRDSLTRRIDQLHQAGIVVSLFVDPDTEQLKACARVKADYIEIHTGSYCDAEGDEQKAELAKIAESIKLGKKLGMGVNAGHGLNYRNIKPVLALGGVEEYNIGHSIISRAVLVGLDRAVKEMAQLVHGAK